MKQSIFRKTKYLLVAVFALFVSMTTLLVSIPKAHASFSFDDVSITPTDGSLKVILENEGGQEQNTVFYIEQGAELPTLQQLKEALGRTEDVIPHKAGYEFMGFYTKKDFPSDDKTAFSALYALLEGISLAFVIERSDIDGLVLWEDGKTVFVLFDTVPGGAGHVKRMQNREEMIRALKFAYDKVNQDCCDTACYNCIKNFKNQRYHSKLSRLLAKSFLEKIIEKIDIV